MKLISRFIYLMYYLKETNYKQLGKFVDYASSKSHKSKFRIITDALYSVFRFNISPKDYFCFRFFEVGKEERVNWAGTGFMYEYQLMMNPKNSRDKLEDKLKFLNYFKSFTNRKFYSLGEIQSNLQELSGLMNNKSGKLVLKGSHGQVGAEIEVINCSRFNPESLVQYMKDHHYDLIEEYVVQHPSLMQLSPSGLNTVRVFTQLHNGDVKFLGARLRITVNSPVDNMAAGNLAAPVNLETGLVEGPGVYSDITREERKVHPVTGYVIAGFQIPFWEEVLSIVRKAAVIIPDNKSIGWDVAITESGPELIEGNHNWCKLLWQMPVKKGLKKDLEIYLQ